MQGSLKILHLAVLVAVSGLGATPARADDRPADFGKRWVREHPFTIMGAVWGADEWAYDLNLYQGMNLNTVFANNTPAVARNAADAGVTWHGAGYMTGVTRPVPVYTEANKAMFNQLIARGHATAWNVNDEPTEVDIENVAINTQWMKDNHPQLLTYVTEGGGHSIDFFQSVIGTIQPDLFMFDAYPFHRNDDIELWFQYVMNVRQVSLANQIPYGGWLQAFTIENVGFDLRTPSASDTRYNGFTLLTAGYTMLNYFMYDHGAAGTGSVSKFFDHNGNPTAMYHYTATANREYANLGQSLRFLTSTDVRFVPGLHRSGFLNLFTSPNDTPSGLENWESGAGGDSHIQSVSVNTSQSVNLGSEKNGLIGFFTDDDGEQYFMLTNLNHGGNLSAADASLSFVVTFGNSVDSIWLLNRLTGDTEEVLLSDHVLNWTLPGGTGDLFKYDNGNFAGVVPEPTSLMLLGLGVLTILRRHP